MALVVRPLYDYQSRFDATTLNIVGESDWLERGHGGGDGLRPMIKGSTGRAADRVSIRSVLRGGDLRSPRRPRRRTKALVGWLVYCCMAVGGTAAAFSLRDTLFPQLGGPTKALWVSPTPEIPLTTEHGASSSTEANNSAPAATQTARAGATAGASSSIDDQTVPSASSPDADQGNAIDAQGTGANAGPATGTTVSHDPNGGHGTFVDEGPTDTSKPDSSANADPTPTTVSTPGSPASSTSTTVDTDGGKGSSGGSSGRGGGGGGDGGRTTNPTTP